MFAITPVLFSGPDKRRYRRSGNDRKTRYQELRAFKRGLRLRSKLAVDLGKQRPVASREDTGWLPRKLQLQSA
jgi:hypothetical protein